MDYTILGLNGGGMRGALQIGALQQFSEDRQEKHLHNIFTGGVYGISVGALIAAMIAFEFSVDELELLTGVLGNIQEFVHPLNLGSVANFMSTNGLDDGSKIYTLIETEFKKRDLDLSTLRIGDAAIPLHIVASDLTDLKTVIFGPSVRVWDALRASFSLPYIFTPHVVDGHLFVDGAVLCQRIMNVIPKHVREQALLLLTTQTREITVENYITRVPFCRSTKESHTTKTLYPRNTCLLVEDNTQMFSFWESGETMKHLIGVGRSAYLQFRTESIHQKLTEDGGLGRTEILECLG